MRLLFTGCLVGIALGLAAAIVLGVMHR